METEFKSETQFGVSIEVSKSTKGIFSYTIKVSDIDSEKCFNKVIELTSRLNKTYPQETRE